MYLAGLINKKLYITDEKVTYKGVDYMPLEGLNIPNLKFFKTKDEIYRHFNMMNKKDKLYLLETNEGAKMYVVAEEEDMARDKANKYVKERYGNFAHITGFAKYIAEVEPTGRADKLIY